MRSLASGSGPGRTCPGDFLGGNADPTNFAIMATIVWFLVFLGLSILTDYVCANMQLMSADQNVFPLIKFP